MLQAHMVSTVPYVVEEYFAAEEPLPAESSTLTYPTPCTQTLNPTLQREGRLNPNQFLPGGTPRALPLSSTL